MSVDLLEDAEAAQAAQAFAALGAPQRLAILRCLVRAGPTGLPVGALGDRLGVAPSTLSHHISALVRADLIGQRREGRSLLCHAKFDRVEGLAAYLVRECCRDEGPR
ncbi:MAG: metalloregulator ArsR/SmtB family transcription factor [Pseudomonadota bacterium]